MRIIAIAWDATSSWSSVLPSLPSSPIVPPSSWIHIRRVTGSIWRERTSYWAIRRRRKRRLEHGLVADPNTPDLAWEAGNFYLVQGETDKALREFRVVMESDPSCLPPRP